MRNLGKDPQLWNLPVEGEHLVADYLQEQLSLEDTEGGLAESLHQAANGVNEVAGSVTTAASACAWACKWIMLVEMWLNGDIGDELAIEGIY